MPNGVGGILRLEYEMRRVRKSMPCSQEEVEGEVFNLCTHFESSFERHARHLFHIRFQLRHYQDVRNELGNVEAALHIDFSKNDSWKLSSGVQICFCA